MYIHASEDVFTQESISDDVSDILKNELETSFKNHVRNILSEWWLANISDIPLTSDFDKYEIKSVISSLETYSKSLITSTIDGWQSLLKNESSTVATITLAKNKKQMVGQSVTGDVIFNLKGKNLSLDAKDYKLQRMDFDISLPDSPIKVEIDITGSIDVKNNIINTKTFSLNGISINIGGFIEISFKGRITHKTIEHGHQKFDLWQISAKNLSLVINYDPGNVSSFTLISSGEFFQFVDPGVSVNVSNKVDSLKTLSLSIGEFEIDLGNINIDSSDNRNYITTQIKSAIYSSLAKSGIDLGFSIYLGEGFQIKLEHATLINDSNFREHYSFENAIFSLSIDTKIGPVLVPLGIEIIFDSELILETDISRSYAKSFKFYTEATEVFQNKLDFSISDVKINMENLRLLDTISIDRLFNSLLQYNESGSTGVTLSYDSSINLSSVDFEELVNFTLTGDSESTIIGNHHDNVIIGNSVGNIIYGMSGDDVLRGNDGDDTLVGGSGADQIDGGVGADLFVFENISDSPANSPDKLINFSGGDGDKLRLVGLAEYVTDGENLIFATSLKDGRIGSKPLPYGIWFKSSKLFVDATGDSKADMIIMLTGNKFVDPEWIEIV